MGKIYCIVNKVNGKKYIGQTKHSSNKRIKEHFNIARAHSKNLHLYNAINKYGEYNFDVHILRDDVPEEELDKWEIYYIALYDTFNTGYNNTKGGKGVSGFHFKPETIERVISHRDYSKLYTPERNKKISDALKGIPKSEAHRALLSAKAKLRVGEKNPFYGKHHKPESIKKLKESSYVYKYKQIDLATGDVINIFSNIDDVYNYILSNKLSYAKETSIKYRVYATIEGRQSQAYGYGWVAEKCNDYPDRE